MLLSVFSRQYVYVPVTCTVADVVTDPSADPVRFAFTAVGANPVSGDWVAASWSVSAINPNGQRSYWAKCLVGPGGASVKTLVAGSYDVWLEITDSLELTVAKAGFVLVQ
jgi:hypothetical protein